MDENYKEFLDLVDQMRTAQKEYFKSRSAAALNKSKSLERSVDSHIKEAKNPNLFA